jgi:gliding motility-associated-like protein
MNRFSTLIFILLFSSTVFAQGVCDIKNNVEKGGFVFDGPAAVCKGQEVKIKDNSGGTDIKYIFGYNGEDASKLPSLNPTTDTKWSFLASGQYVILQYGKKNGKDMYFCNLATVREDNQPKASYSTCNNQVIELTIPNDTKINDFDYYNVSWGDGSSPEIVNKNQLPYNKSRNLSLPRTIKIEGFFTGGNNCPTPSSIVLPILLPSTFPSGYTQPFFPNIEKIELETAQIAKLEIKGSFQEDGYNLFMTQQGQPYSSTPISKNIKPGSFTINIPDTTKSYCFYLQRNIACGFEQSAEICTVVLSDVKALDKQNTITWNEYPISMTGITNTVTFGRYINRTQKLQKKENGNTLTPIPVNSSNGSFTETIDCAKKYCYRIIAETQGQLYYNAFKGQSISKEICVDRKEIHPNPITDAFVTVNNADNAEIKFNDDSPWTLNRKRYILYRDNGIAFVKLDSSDTNKQFTDKTADASQKSYCYKVSFVDECGSTSEKSSSFCTTHLSETVNGLLQWTTPSPFGNSIVKSFEIQYFDEGTELASTEATQLITTYEPKLDRFEEEARYRIKVIANDSKESFSNIYTVPIKVKMFIPDAFSPNEDGINDDLILKGSFKRFTSFQIAIYNRWGIPVFVSDDITNTWDGKYQNAKAPTDTYTYKIYAQLKDGQEFNKSGKFLLIR